MSDQAIEKLLSAVEKVVTSLSATGQHAWQQLVYHKIVSSLIQTIIVGLVITVSVVLFIWILGLTRDVQDPGDRSLYKAIISIVAIFCLAFLLSFLHTSLVGLLAPEGQLIRDLLSPTR